VSQEDELEKIDKIGRRISRLDDAPPLLGLTLNVLNVTGDMRPLSHSNARLEPSSVKGSGRLIRDDMQRSVCCRCNRSQSKSCN
jgi:hypothetical protein